MWKDIWEKKGKNIDCSNLTLSDLISIDGFDSSGKSLEESNWIGYAKHICISVNDIKNKKNILEIGCGAGAFLKAMEPFLNKESKIYGIDYSQNLINIAKHVFNSENFNCIEAIDIDKLYLGDITTSFYNKEENYVIVSDYRDTNYLLMAGDNRIPSFSVQPYIARYGNDFYYRLFGMKELQDFEQNFSKYTTGRKFIKYNKEFMSLLNKMQSISENKLYVRTNLFEKFNKTWDFYISNDKTDLESYLNIGLDKYQIIYKNNFEYLKLLSEVRYSKINNLNSIIATITAIIATIISIIALKS